MNQLLISRSIGETLGITGNFRACSQYLLSSKYQPGDQPHQYHLFCNDIIGNSIH